MNVTKGTKCVLSKIGHYNFYYMSQHISEFNRDCVVIKRSFSGLENEDYFAVETQIKNIGLYEHESKDNEPIIVWIKK